MDRRDFLRVSASAAGVLTGCVAATEAGVTLDDATLRTQPSPPIDSAQPGLHRLDLHWVRDGFLYVPAGNSPAVQSPLVVLLHGAGRGANEWWESGNLRAIADDLSLLVVTPDSRSGTWDLISSGGFGPDVQFIDRALAHTFRRCYVDPTRVALGGFSDGASYALSLGLANGNLFETIIAHSPGFFAPPDERGLPRVYITHGTDDQVIPIEASRVIERQLRSRGHTVEYIEFDGGHTVGAARGRQALEWFLASPSASEAHHGGHTDGRQAAVGEQA